MLGANILLATLSNSQKMDPQIFHVWMNIMQRFAGSKMIVMDYKGSEIFMPNLKNYSRLYFDLLNNNYKSRVLL